MKCRSKRGVRKGGLGLRPQICHILAVTDCFSIPWLPAIMSISWCWKDLSKLLFINKRQVWESSFAPVRGAWLLCKSGPDFSKTNGVWVTFHPFASSYSSSGQYQRIESGIAALSRASSHWVWHWFRIPRIIHCNHTACELLATNFLGLPRWGDTLYALNLVFFPGRKKN